MKKLLSTALILTALPFTFDGVTPAVSKAHAIVGRPLTPMSVAGVHRRAVRRTFGVGANLGYSGFYHRNFGPYAYNRLGYGYHPVARAAVYGATAYGAGWGSSGWNRPLYAYAGPAYRPVARAALRRGHLRRWLGRLGLESPTLWLRWHEPRLGRRMGRLGLESPTLFLRRHEPRLGRRLGLGWRLARLGLESRMGVVIERPGAG